MFISVFTGLHLDRLGLEPIQPGPGPAFPKAAALTVVVLVMLHFSELYDLRRVWGRRELLLRLFLGLGAAFLVMAIVGYLGPAFRLGRKAYVLSFLISFAVLFGIRLAYTGLVRSVRTGRRLLLLGSGRPAQIIADAVNGSHPNYEMIGCVDGHPELIGQKINGVAILGTVEELGHVSRMTRPDVIVVALKERRGSLPLQAILDCKMQGIEVEDWPGFFEKLTGKIYFSDLRPSWLVFSDGFKTNDLTLTVKRGMDIAMAVIALVLSLPLFPLIALAIKLDSPGPVFYLQERLGRARRIFRLIKFRTMREERERRGPVPAGEHDAYRVTRVGSILRRTRLDELPQLINILFGEMSMVGPRPEWVAYVNELQEKIPFYIHRLAVKPGLTGWAQVKHRHGSTIEDTLEKLQYDLYYIKNLSIFLDLLILLHTLHVLLFTRGSR